VDPGLLVAEKGGDGRRGQLVIVQERGDDPGFVHGACRLADGVGRKQPGLHGRARDLLHHDGDLCPALDLPGHQALEAVDDLEASLRSRGHPKRHGSQGGLRIGPLATESGQRGAQLVNGDELQGNHRW